MKVTRKMLINMVKGTEPNYDVMDHPLVRKAGSHVGGFYDRREWHSVEELTNSDLEIVYKTCEDSREDKDKCC